MHVYYEGEDICTSGDLLYAFSKLNYKLFTFSFINLSRLHFAYVDVIEFQIY